MSSNKVAIIFTEGDTDYIFYKNLLEYLIEKKGPLKSRIKNINIKGVGKFSSKVPAKYKNEIVKKYPEFVHNIFLAYDSDVFELIQKPPVDWNKIENLLNDLGANSISHLKAESMIEDWFLFDVEGICKNLKIKAPQKLKGNSGFEKIQYLFKRANRIYQKGYNSNNFIESLNLKKIYPNIKDDIIKLEEKIFTEKCDV